jgi:hypothetical protein
MVLDVTECVMVTVQSVTHDIFLKYLQHCRFSMEAANREWWSEFLFEDIKFLRNRLKSAIVTEERKGKLLRLLL